MLVSYRNMNLKQIFDLLQERNLGTAGLRNEVGKIYGVSMLPPQQVAAREEAIKLLEEFDSHIADPRKSITKRRQAVTFRILAAAASIVTLIVFAIDLMN